MDIHHFFHLMHVYISIITDSFEITKDKDLVFSRANSGSGPGGKSTWCRALNFNYKRIFSIQLVVSWFLYLACLCAFGCWDIVTGSVRLLSGINHMLHDKIFSFGHKYLFHCEKEKILNYILLMFSLNSSNMFWLNTHINTQSHG